MLAALLSLLITALPLPQYHTVPTPFTKDAITRDPFSAGGDVIAADTTAPLTRGGIAVWRDGTPLALPSLEQSAPYAGEPPPFLELGAVAPDGVLFAMRGQMFSGAYSGVAYDPLRLSASRWTPAPIGGCAVGWNVAHVERVEDDGTQDVTFESPELVNLDEAHTGAYAPYAARVRGNSCHVLGRFNLRDVRGHYAVGFRGYLYGVLAPTNLNLTQQRYVAVRYHSGTVAELGPGEAFAVSADGVAVGGDAPPMSIWYMVGDSTTGSHTYQCCKPHAMLWDAAGKATALAPQSPESVAYDINASHRVIGTLQGRDGRHYAFIWQRGHLQLLDEMLHAPGWRFEGAYRFLPDGAIVGIGTHNGIATAFVVRGAISRATPR